MADDFDKTGELDTAFDVAGEPESASAAPVSAGTTQPGAATQPGLMSSAKQAFSGWLDRQNPNSASGRAAIARHNAQVGDLSPKRAVKQGMAALDSVTFGLADDAVAHLRGEALEDGPQSWRRMFDRAVAEEPGAAVAGQMALAPIPGATGRGFLARAGTGALLSGGQGGASAYGHSDKRGLDALKQAWPAAAVTAVLGGGLGAATGPWGRTADDMTMKALGLRGGITNQMKNMGLATGDDVAALGRDIRKAGLVGPLDSPGDIAKKADALTTRAGQEAGTSLAAADRMGAPDPTRTGVAALEPLRTFKQGGATPENAAAQGAKLEAFANQLADELPTFKALNANKSAAWKSANMKDDAPIAAELYRKGVGQARNDIEAQVREVAGPKVADALRQANRKFGTAADAYNLASDADTRDAHKWLLPGLLASAAGGAAGGVKGAGVGASSALAAYLAKRYGPPLMSNIGGAAERVGLDAAHLAGPATQGTNSLAEYLRLLEEKDTP